MNHNIIESEYYPVSYMQVFRCECGFVLQKLVPEMARKMTILERDLFEGTVVRIHAVHRAEESTLDLMDLGELPQAQIREITPRTRLELEAPNVDK